MIRMTLFFWRSLACALLATAMCAAPASAGFSTANYEPCCSTEDIGSFRAELTYSYTGGTSATVSIMLTNDVDPSLGGYITAIALRPNETASGLSFVSSSSAAFLNIAAPVSAPPYGTFTAGAGLNGSFLGGGNPSAGIATGSSRTFTFTMTGSASALAALDAETALSQNSYGMVVRFRGGQGGWSDKVVGCALPAPGALALLGAVGILPTRRRRG
jgi:hypothetical protein